MDRGIRIPRSVGGLLLALALSAPAAVGAEDLPAPTGEVAMAVSLPDATPTQRDVAAGIAQAAHAQFGMTEPPLAPEAVEGCQAEENCLLALARTQGAEALLTIGVVALGDADFVVAIKVLATADGKELAAFSDLAKPGTDARQAGFHLGQQTFATLQGRFLPHAPPTAGTAATAASAPYDGLSELSWAGWGVTGAGALLTLGTFALGTAGTLDPAGVGGQAAVDAVISVGGITSISVLLAGLSLVAADGFFPHTRDIP